MDYINMVAQGSQSDMVANGNPV